MVKCKSCALHKYGEQYFKPNIKKAKLVIVAPYFNNFSMEIPYLQKWMKEMNLGKNDVYFTSLLKCKRVKKDDSQEYYDTCYEENLVNEIYETGAKVILLFGNRTVETILGKDYKISEYLNKPIEAQEFTFFVSYSLSSIEMGNISENVIRKSFRTAMNKALGVETKLDKIKTIQIKTYKQLIELYDNLMDKSSWAFDLETMGLDFGDKIIGCSFSWDRKKGYYLPILEYNPLIGWAKYKIKDKPTVDLYLFLKEVLEDSEAEKIAHNAKFELSMLSYELKIKVHNLIHDTQVIHYLLAQHVRNHSLETISDLYEEFAGYKETIKEFKKYGWEKIPLSRISEYGAKDSILTYRYWEDYYPQMSDKMREIAYKQVVIPGVHLLADIESRGIYIDLKQLKKLEAKLDKEIDKLYNEIVQDAGFEINPSSPDQMRHYIFDILKLPTKGVKKGKKGYSTDEATLKMLAETTKNKGILKILDYRKAIKAQSMYVVHLNEKAKPLKEDADVGLYHPNFKVTRTATGRLASGSEVRKSLNMQNVPVRNDVWNIKGLFRARNGWLIAGADYSQIEMRILAYVTQDEALLYACNNDFDIHSFVASSYSGYSYEEIVEKKHTDEKFTEIRRGAKTIGFGWVYGALDGKFAEIFGSVQAEKLAKRAYFKKFNRIMEWKKEALAKFRKTGYVETITGRRRYIPEILDKSKAEWQIAAAEREAINTLIQSPASDYLFKAASNLNEYFIQSDIPARAYNLIHDAIYIYLLEQEMGSIIYEVKKELLKPKFDIDVTMAIELEVASRWDLLTKKPIYTWEGSKVNE